MEVIVTEGQAFLKTMDGALKKLGPVVESSASVEELDAQATPLEIAEGPVEPPMEEPPADMPMPPPAPEMGPPPPADTSGMPVRKRLEEVAGRQFND
jgi:hypothetical protein